MGYFNFFAQRPIILLFWDILVKWWRFWQQTPSFADDNNLSLGFLSQNKFLFSLTASLSCNLTYLLCKIYFCLLSGIDLENEKQPFLPFFLSIDLVTQHLLCDINGMSGLEWTVEMSRFEILFTTSLCDLLALNQYSQLKQTNPPQNTYWQVISAFTLFRKPNLFIFLWFLRHRSSSAHLGAFWLLVSIPCRKKIVGIEWSVTCKGQRIGYSILKEVREVKFLEEYY